MFFDGVVENSEMPNNLVCPALCHEVLIPSLKQLREESECSQANCGMVLPGIVQ